MMLGEYELITETFRTLYLEDYLKLKEEAKEIEKKAEEIRLAGDPIGYSRKIKQCDMYHITADTVLAVAIKRPLADA